MNTIDVFNYIQVKKIKERCDSLGIEFSIEAPNRAHGGWCFLGEERVSTIGQADSFLSGFEAGMKKGGE